MNSTKLLMCALLAAVANAQPGELPKVTVFPIAALTAERQPPSWREPPMGSPFDAAISAPSRPGPRWDADALLELAELSLPALERDPTWLIAPAEAHLVLVASDPVLVQELDDLLQSLHAANRYAEVQFDRGANAGAETRGQVTLQTRLDAPFAAQVLHWQHVPRGVARHEEHQVEATEAVTRGLAVAGVAASDPDGRVRLADVHLHLGGLAHTFAQKERTGGAHGVEQASTLLSARELTLGEDSDRIVFLPGDGILGVRGKLLDLPAGWGPAPLGLPHPRVAYGPDGLAVVQVGNLVSAPFFETTDEHERQGASLFEEGDELVDLISSWIAPATWDEPGALLELQGGTRLVLRNQVWVVDEVVALLGSVADSVPSPVSLTLRISSGAVGEPLEDVHVGDVIARNGGTGTSHGLRRHEIVAGYQTDDPSQAPTPTILVLEGGTHCTLTPLLAGDLGVRVDLDLRHVELAPRSAWPEHATLDLPHAREIRVWTSALLGWNEPVRVAELSDGERRWVVELTAHAEP